MKQDEQAQKYLTSCNDRSIYHIARNGPSCRPYARREVLHRRTTRFRRHGQGVSSPASIDGPPRRDQVFASTILGRRSSATPATTRSANSRDTTSCERCFRDRLRRD